MSGTEFLTELLRPVRDRGMLYGMLGFACLLLLASRAGVFGYWLLFVTVPAFLRFLVYITEARSAGRSTDPPGIELFSLVENLWSFVPLLQIVLAAIATFALFESAGTVAAMLAGALFVTVLPASIGMLALTHNPAAAFHPLYVARLARRCGAAYALVPVAAIVGGCLLWWAARAGAPGLVVQASGLYVLTLVFSLTGTVVGRSGVREEVDIPDPAEPGEARRTERQDREREQVLSHAYGFFSRGNSEGGLAHIVSFIGKFDEFDDSIDEYRWFFNRMMGWETRRHGLVFGSYFLERLVAAGRHAEAMKVLSRCLHEEPAFRPPPALRDPLRDIAMSEGRQDLLQQLR